MNKEQKTKPAVVKKVGELNAEVETLMKERKKSFPDDKAPTTGDDKTKWDGIQEKVKSRKSWIRQLTKNTMTLADLNTARKAEKGGGKRKGGRRVSTPVDEKLLAKLTKAMTGIKGLEMKQTSKFAVFKGGKRNIALIGKAKGEIRVHWYEKPEGLKTEVSKSERAGNYIAIKSDTEINRAVKATEGILNSRQKVIDAKATKTKEAKEAKAKKAKATKKTTKKADTKGGKDKNEKK